MRWILLALAAASFVTYGNAIKNLFSREHGVDPRMTALQAGGVVSALVHLLSIGFYPVPLVLGTVSLAIYAIGLMVFVNARAALQGRRLTLAFSRDIPSGLITTGVYAGVRHPFYLAYSLTWIGGLIAAPSVWTLATSTAMIVWYMYAAQLEEEKFLASPLAAEYTAYRSRAGLLWPRRAARTSS